MWRLADRQIDEFVARGQCEFIHDYARPFTLLVVADLLGVPESEHATFREELQGGEHRRGKVGDARIVHKPLEFLYERFTGYIGDRRRCAPRDDVMTGLATATFPDGSLPEVRDVMLIASDLFAAGQETTARLLGKMLQMIGERPDLQRLLRDERASRTSSRNACASRAPAEHVPAVAHRDHDRRCRDPARHDGDADPRRREPRSAALRVAGGVPPRSSELAAAPRLRLRHPQLRRRTAGARRGRDQRRASARPNGRHPGLEAEHGPPGARRYEYPATYMLRGIEHLHLEFAPRA